MPAPNAAALAVAAAAVSIAATAVAAGSHRDMRIVEDRIHLLYSSFSVFRFERTADGCPMDPVVLVGRPRFS